MVVCTTGDMARPQDSFEDRVDNSNAPFAGKLDHWQDLPQVQVVSETHVQNST